MNTGEVLVALDGVESGEALTGDTVNTAARLQTVAPLGGVVVGERTLRAVEAVFEFEELGPAELKGKSEPVRVFRVAGPRERTTDLPERRGTVFVGRESELGRLREAFDEAVGSRSARLITVVGEPGLGKSRLVAELRESVGTVTWRTGCCLPYGEGIAYWPFREIVNAHAGILDSDEAEIAERKLLAELPEGPERPWLRERMLPLLGPGSP